MRRRRSAAVISVAVLLSGCGQSFYEFGADALRKDPKVRAAALQDCVKDMQRKPLPERRMLSSATGVSLARMPQVFCDRIVAGVASGRITYADLQNDQDDKLIRVVRGR